MKIKIDHEAYTNRPRLTPRQRLLSWAIAGVAAWLIFEGPGATTFKTALLEVLTPPERCVMRVLPQHLCDLVSDPSESVVQ